MKLSKTILLLACFVLLFAGKPPGTGYAVGDKVADFKLKNVDGKMVSLADYKDAKGAIVIFDCNTCPMSKAYNERIIKLNEKYASKSFPLIAINPNSPDESPGDSYKEMVRYAKDKGYKFPYLYDESQKVVRDFGATNTPHVFVLKREGNEYKVAYIGAIDNSRDEDDVDKKYVEDAVDAILSGKPVSTTKTKAIGCSIKWKNA